MEPTSKALQTLAGAVRENTQGVGRSPLDVLQVINLKKDIHGQEGGFKDLLRAETGRADARRASRSGTPEPTNRPPERSDTQAGRAEDGSRKASEGSETAETGKTSPAADRNLPPASEGNTAQPPNNDASGERITPDAESRGDAPEQAASIEEPDTQVVGQAESEIATEVEPEVLMIADERLVDTSVPTEGEARSAQSVATDEQPVTRQADGQEVSDAAEVMPASAVTEIPAGSEILLDAEDVAVAAGPAVVGNGSGKTGLTGREQAAERVAVNLDRNPDAAGDGLRRAQEAIAQAAAKGAPGNQPATPEASGRSATTGGIEIAGRATEAPILRDTSTADAQPAAPRPTAAPTAAPTPQMPFTGELNPQLRMPAAAAAQQAEQALAAKAMVGEVIDAKISAAANATATTAAATAQVATTSPAQATEAARAALQQVRASFARPGWDQAMAQRVAQLAARGVQSAQIEVDPPELGPVKVVIQVNNDSQTSVSFSSPHAGVREVLEQTAQRLREALADAGMDLVDVEVSDQSAERREESAEDAQDREPGTGAHAWRSGDTDADVDAPVTVMVRDSDALVDHYV